MKLFIGYFLLALSCVAWALLVVVPFLPLGTEQKLAWGGGLYVFGQVTWFGCLPFLGKEFIDRTRRLWAGVRGWFSNR